MCDSTSDKCGCGEVPTKPEKPAVCTPEDAKPCDEDPKDQACDKESAEKKSAEKKSGGCCG